MKKILVCGGENEKLSEFLQAHRMAPRFVHEVSAAELAAADAVLFVLLPPGRWEAAARLAAEQRVPVVAVVRAGERAGAEAALAGTGVPVLEYPIRHGSLLMALRISQEMNERLRTLGSENERLKSALSDMKLVDRAKCTLIQYLGMTEAEAHRFIEKRAMDKRLPKREIAMEILKTYEN